ncbi:hypothetical protein [Clostridium pasteurianum]|uniref:Uncharacterized protein n=1 Tax=Clostridium pasteurianum BC1 TaxID=86416 RepID=R4JX56_CLOPA|nr:hypothetical protein [Clostridium pasteurianum]AGK95407.1 hypothetical protein Clopa_0345 [Clostridium pasteurianum BC1]
MLDVKTWLQSTGLPVAETAFIKPPSLPYIVFLTNDNIAGGDNKNCISDRSIGIELYSSRIDRDSESKIENLLNEKAIEYKKNRTWIPEDTFFETMYDFNLIEKF